MNKDKPAIGILINALNLGGAEKQSLLQAKLMAGEFEVYYLVQRKMPRLTQHLDFIATEKINYIQLSGGLVSRSIQLISILKRKNIKVLFSYLTLDNVLASMVAPFVHIKYVGGIRNSYLPRTKFFFNRIAHKYFLDYTIFNNYEGRNLFLKRGYVSSKCLVIHNCIDFIQPDMIRPERNTVKILSVGRFTIQKDYLTALKAVLRLRKNYPEKNIEFTIVGDGELDQQIQTWIRDLELDDVKVVRLPENIHEYYKDADIYLLSSLFEGLPNSVMEALNYCLPVVSTDVSDVSYLVKDGINGYLAATGDYEMLAEKLGILVSDRAKRIEFGVNGHQLLINNFSPEKYRETYNRFTHQILDSLSFAPGYAGRPESNES
jgi:glycosyltransferase involved in cell wall biosynthesis